MEKRVRIEIDQKGNFTFEALEGFTGDSCISKTQDLELMLGGVETDSGVKSEYYEPDDVSIFVEK